MTPILLKRSRTSTVFSVIIVGITILATIFETYCVANDDDLIVRLLKTSGLISEIEQIHSSIWLALPSDAFSNETQRNESYRRFRKALPTEYLLSVIQSQVQIDFDSEKMESVIRFYETGLGRKLARIQRDLLRTYNIRNLREGRKTAALLEETRLELISKIISIQKASEVNSELGEIFARSLLIGKIPPENGSNASGQLSEKHRSSLRLERNLIDETILLSYANNLRVFDDKELIVLIDFFETPEAKWFQTTRDSFNKKIVQEIGSALAETLSRQAGKNN